MTERQLDRLADLLFVVQRIIDDLDEQRIPQASDVRTVRNALPRWFTQIDKTQWKRQLKT